MPPLRQRLQQMYTDLEPLMQTNVGNMVATAYNALLQEVTKALAGEDLVAKGITQVGNADDGSSVRLLVGQLILIVGNR
jgi:hypothetical protein